VSDEAPAADANERPRHVEDGVVGAVGNHQHGLDRQRARAERAGQRLLNRRCMGEELEADAAYLDALFPVARQLAMRAEERAEPRGRRRLSRETHVKCKG